MANIYNQGKNFFCNLVWLSPLMGGIVPTAKYLIKARGNPMKFGHGFYNEIAFKFRNCDTTAIKEVIVDEEYEFLDEFLKNYDEPNIVDVGAHIGTFSLWVYHRNPKARILMVEANPASYDILLYNTDKTFSEGQHKVLNRAAWKNNDTLHFSTSGDSMGNKVSTNGDTLIGGITFSEIVEIATQDNSSIDLIKIDIEGAEEAFFETDTSTLEKIKRLVIELHPKYCETSGIIKKLESRYKHVRNISGRIDAKPVLYCTDDY